MGRLFVHLGGTGSPPSLRGRGPVVRPPAEPLPAGPGSCRPGAHELPQRIKPEPGKARREVGDRLGPGCGEIEGGPGPRESARRPSMGSGRVTRTTSIVAAARSGSPWLGRAPPVGLEWIASALPWLARPPPPGGMTRDPRAVAAGLRAPDLPWVIAQKEHSAARRADLRRDRRVQLPSARPSTRIGRRYRARRAPRRPGPRPSARL